MKLAFVHLCGFRGYEKPVKIEFSEGFTIIDGRNGAGKSTVFDAVEFALTGTISKYLDAKSGRESVADYLWWSGGGEGLAGRFVEVGFRDGEDVVVVRRTPLEARKVDVPEKLSSRLVDPSFAPRLALSQLCSSTIIRDEHIARLSLDLKEGDRFALLRDAIGAVDAEDWIRRAHALASAASARVKAATSELEQASQSLAGAARQIDQARAALPAVSMVNEAAARLQNALKISARLDQLVDTARLRVAEIAKEVDALRPLAQQYRQTEGLREALPQLESDVAAALETLAHARVALAAAAAAAGASPPSTALGASARQLVQLADLGRAVDRRGGHCPLCASAVGHDAFVAGVEAALAAARQLDAQAVEQAARERAHDAALMRCKSAEDAVGQATGQRDAINVQLAEFDERLDAFALRGAGLADIERRLATLEAQSLAIAADLRVVDTILMDRAIQRAASDQNDAKEKVSRAEARLGKARLAETRAKAIYDATRRAAAETLDQRLDRVLPLMSELYKRLRPHPVWNDIEYSVRGDVQRFLKLQVGGDINPQFVFSSGQRRATGLAFLLSVNLSITWSRWRSILLDDPVQHVDDFRTVHLAEVLSHLCYAGRQIVCAVEDSALADLMCRRLPSTERAPGKRVTLGTDNDGAIAVVRQQIVAPASRRALVALRLSAG